MISTVSTPPELPFPCSAGPADDRDLRSLTEQPPDQHLRTESGDV